MNAIKVPDQSENMTETISKKFSELGVSLPMQVVSAWSIENLVNTEELDNLVRLLDKAKLLVKERRVHMLRHMSRIPQVDQKTFDNFETDRFTKNNVDALNHLKSLAFIGMGENVVIVGDQGTGKTHIAQAVGNICCDSQISVRYFKMAELVAKIKDSILKNKREDLIASLTNVQCLIIDEMGYCNTLPESEANVFFQILDRRYDKGKRPTIFTSNKMPSEWNSLFFDKELAKCILDRIMDRCIAIEIRGSSYRGKSRKIFKINCSNNPEITGLN